MENAEIENGETWEEELYWKHFHQIRFYKVLPSDFFHQLVLPSKFAEKMSDKVPKKLSLIGPSGSSWDVDVSTTGNIAIVGEGWKDFAKSFKLEENYMLLFKYTKNLSFEVLIFDQRNRCEKESSYFVKNGLPNLNDDIDEMSEDESGGTEIFQDEVFEDDDIDSSDSDCVIVSENPKKCLAFDDDDDQREKNVVEAPITTLSDSVEDDDIDGGGSDCVMLESSAEDDQGEKNFVEAPVTTPLAEFDLSGKTKADAVEVVSSEGRANEADDTHDKQKNVLVVGLVATNSKGQLAKKPSDDTTVSKTLSQHKAIQQTPPGNGENETYDALSAEAMNGSGIPGTLCPPKTIVKKRRSERAISRSGKKVTFNIDTQTFSKEYLSQTRVVTDGEKEAAVKRAADQH